ncbi:hypothetical protein SDC9_207471 [bioreactor metagenome]|uniref:Uncharacterized protein n=1 Tax=bioreactor metagenome TaxID=1076179 RepID=A0A645JAJ4_9ZZZZ
MRERLRVKGRFDNRVFIRLTAVHIERFKNKAVVGELDGGISGDVVTASFGGPEVLPRQSLRSYIIHRAHGEVDGSLRVCDFFAARPIDNTVVL